VNSKKADRVPAHSLGWLNLDTRLSPFLEKRKHLRLLLDIEQAFPA
jgi:hypothetical protein